MRCAACNKSVGYRSSILESDNDDLCGKCRGIAEEPFQEYTDNKRELTNVTEGIPDENTSKYFYEWHDNG